MSDSIQSLVRNYLSMQICSFWRLLLEKWAIFDLFWPLGCPKKDQNLFVLNERQYKICDQKLYLFVNLQLLGVILRGMGNFWPFYLPLTTRVPQNGSKYVVWQKKKKKRKMPQTNSSCKIMYICRILASRSLLVMTNFDPLFDRSGIKQFWKIILRSIKNHWETNLSKIIQKILVLDLSPLVFRYSVTGHFYMTKINF